jgi:hypothetical protein
MWDERKLKEWEEDCNGGAPWPGRAVRDARLMRGETVHRDSQERGDDDSAPVAQGTDSQAEAEQGGEQ